MLKKQHLEQRQLMLEVAKKADFERIMNMRFYNRRLDRLDKDAQVKMVAKHEKNAINRHALKKNWMERKAVEKDQQTFFSVFSETMANHC